jgi:membrane-bound inhibitor of C-type lysozyme
MIQRLAALVGLALMAATTLGIPAQASTPTETLVFLCADARVVSMVQPKPPTPGQAVDVAFGAERKRMSAAPAASGARYLSGDGAWQWWTKGRTARLSMVNGNTSLASSCELYPTGASLSAAAKNSN